MTEAAEVVAEENSSRVPPDLFGQLADASPVERTRLCAALLDAQGERPLTFAERDGSGVTLDQIDFSAERAASTWWDAELSGVRLRGAILPRASLRRARLPRADLRDADLHAARLGEIDLSGARLDGADLSGADLAGANLAGAALGEARLQDALLEEANLERATLRFARLENAVLERSNLRHADLWGATLDNADLRDVDLRGGILREASLRGANLSGARLDGALLGHADLSGATLTGASLEGANLTHVRLSGAVLRDTRLEGVDLSSCDLTHIHVGGIRLSHTRLEQEQLGGAIGEELSGEFDAARRGYLALERNFAELGDSDAASWAYRRKRRMQKLAARTSAQAAYRTKKWRLAATAALQYVADRFVEWLCDYGESIPRVLRAMVFTYVLFTVVYAVTGWCASRRGRASCGRWC